MATTTKKSELDQIHIEYLDELAISLVTKRDKRVKRSSKEDYVSYLSEKLTMSQVAEVVNLYSSGVPGRLAATMISPDSVETIVECLGDHFQGDGLREVKVGKRACDYVIPEALIAIEIKSGRDNLDKAESQLFDYKRWADAVYLVYDKKHRGNIPPPIKENGVGLLEFDGQIMERQKPNREPSDTLDLLHSMTKSYLIEISNVYGISSRGKKDEIAIRLADQLSRNIVRLWFGRFLYQRSIDQNN